MWFLIEVDIAEDIGTQETERVYINNVDIETKEIDEDPDKFSAKVYGRYVHPATIELNQFNAPKETEKEDPFSLISKFKRHLLVEFGNACRKYYGSQMDPYYGGQVEIIAKQMKILSIDDTTIHRIMDEEKELSQKINGSTSMFVAGEEIKPGTTVEQREDDKVYPVKPLTKTEMTEDKENNTPTEDCKNTIDKMYTLIHNLEDKYHESVEAFEERIKLLENKTSIENDTPLELLTYRIAACEGKFDRLLNKTKSLQIYNEEYARNINILFERIGDLEKKFETGSEYDKLVLSGLSKEIAELEQAFESECEHYDKDLKEIKLELSQLQRAFVKHAICEKTELPRGGTNKFTAAEHIEPYQFVYMDSNEKIIRPYTNPKQIPSVQITGISINNKSEHDKWVEKQKNVRTDPLPPKEPDIIEQIKAGEKRLIQLYKFKNSLYSSNEIRTLKEHLLQLINLEYNIELDTLVVTVLYKIYYMNHKKGIRFEFI